MAKDYLKFLYHKLGTSIYLLIVTLIIMVIRYWNEPTISYLYENNIPNNPDTTTTNFFNSINEIISQIYLLRGLITVIFLIAFFSLMGYIILLLALISGEKKKLKKEALPEERKEPTGTIEKAEVKRLVCPSCGAELLDKTSAFCSKCGAPVK